jgi:aminoglycoside phosphotransferase (APT) family kinase protein
VPDASRVDLRHSWLALVVPATARRFRVVDRGIVGTLVQAGAQIVDHGADVEIARSARALRGGALCVLVPVERSPPRFRLRGLRAVERLFGALRVRFGVAAASVVIRVRGYPDVDVVTWELDLPARFRGWDATEMRSRFPMRAIVIGRREPMPTLLDAAVAATSEERPLRSLGASTHGGAALTFTRRGLLRVAVGPAAARLERQLTTLEILQALNPPPVVADRVPWTIDSGRIGLGLWVLERRLPGAAPAAPPSDRLLATCIDFLVALFETGRDLRPDERPSLAARADAVAAAGEPGYSDGIRALGRRLDRELEALPRGFVHGDFWLGNLLVHDNALSGVADWEAAGPGGLPLVDLLQLLVHWRSGSGQALGEGTVLCLLPRLRRDAGSVRAYCERVGLDVEQDELEALCLASWLETAGYGIANYERTGDDVEWLERNVNRPIRALVANGLLREYGRAGDSHWLAAE